MHAHTYLQDLLLVVRGLLQRLHHKPRALVVLDVRANLADHLRVTKAVQVVVLNLRAKARAGGRQNLVRISH
eukprot:scaffold235677_cov36-Prasinocladus_malaysianus.AAC.1